MLLYLLAWFVAFGVCIWLPFEMRTVKRQFGKSTTRTVALSGLYVAYAAALVVVFITAGIIKDQSGWF